MSWSEHEPLLRSRDHTGLRRPPLWPAPAPGAVTGGSKRPLPVGLGGTGMQSVPSEPFCGQRARHQGSRLGPAARCVTLLISPNSVHTPCHRHGRGQVQLRCPGHAGALAAGGRRGEDLQPHWRRPGLVEGRGQRTGEWGRVAWLSPGRVRAGGHPRAPAPAPCPQPLSRRPGLSPSELDPDPSDTVSVLSPAPGSSVAGGVRHMQCSRHSCVPSPQCRRETAGCERGPGELTGLACTLGRWEGHTVFPPALLFLRTLCSLSTL